MTASDPVSAQQAIAWVSLTYASGNTMTGAPFHPVDLGPHSDPSRQWVQLSDDPADF